MKHRLYTVIDTPIDPVAILSSGDAITGVHMAPHDRALLESLQRDDDALAEARSQLIADMSGELREFTLELEPEGTEFQRKVWAQLRAIPYGETQSYGELASSLGTPNASRAVGAANGKNPIAIVVPCHRVIGANGTLTGFGGGLPRKKWLLEHEQRVVGFRLRS
ncbi:MAG: methylated-DNA--[protein]-cysteine S-methyltransferase [Polyangiaceae bacterium]